MTVTREQAARQLHDIVLEADAYARLHALNLVVFFDSEDKEQFKVVTHCTPWMMGEFCMNLYANIPDEVKNSMIEMEEEAQPEPKVKWSLFWGLFTKYE